MANPISVTGTVSIADISDGATLALTVTSVTLPANDQGQVVSYAPAVTTASVLLGQTLDTPNWNITASPGSGVTGSLVNNTYTVTGLTSDTGAVTFTATRPEFPTLTAVLTLSKVKNAVALRLTADRPLSFTATDGTLDASQANINLTCALSNLTGTPTWSFTGLVSNPTPTGNTVAITAAQFGTSKSARVAVTLGDYTDSVTINRLEKSTADAGANRTSVDSSGNLQLTGTASGAGTAVSNNAAFDTLAGPASAGLLHNWNLSLVGLSGKPSGITNSGALTSSGFAYGDSTKSWLALTNSSVCWPAIPVDDTATYTLTIRHKSGATPPGSGLTIRAQELDTVLARGVSRVLSGAASTTVTLATGAYPSNADWQELTLTYNPTIGTRFMSLAVDALSASVAYHLDSVVLNSTSTATGGSGQNLMASKYSRIVMTMPTCVVSGGTVTQASAGYVSTGAYTLTNTAGAQGLVHFNTSLTAGNVTLAPGQVWLLSAWVKPGVVGQRISLGLRVLLTTGSWATVYAPEFTSTGTGWVRVSGVVDLRSAPYTGTTDAILCARNRSTSDSYPASAATFDALMVEQVVGAVKAPSAYAAPQPLSSVPGVLANEQLSALVMQADSYIVAGTLTDGVVMDANSKSVFVVSGGSKRVIMGYGTGVTGTDYGFQVRDPYGAMIWDSTESVGIRGSADTLSYCIGDSSTNPLYRNVAKGRDNLAIGSGALGSSNATNARVNNIAVGNGALAGATAGRQNIAVGEWAAGEGALSGENNIALGNSAGRKLTSGSYNIYVGTGAGFATTSGSGNIGVGNDALVALTSGTVNVMVGSGFTTLTNGARNVGLGSDVGTQLTTQTDNTFVGYRAGTYTTGSFNTIVGSHSAYSAFSAGSRNVFVGYDAGDQKTSGNANTWIGGYTGSDLASVSNNIVLSDGDGAVAARWQGSHWRIPGALSLVPDYTASVPSNTGVAVMSGLGSTSSTQHGFYCAPTDVQATAQYNHYTAAGTAVPGSSVPTNAYYSALNNRSGSALEVTYVSRNGNYATFELAAGFSTSGLVALGAGFTVAGTALDGTYNQSWLYNTANSSVSGTVTTTSGSNAVSFSSAQRLPAGAVLRNSAGTQIGVLRASIHGATSGTLVANAAVVGTAMSGCTYSAYAIVAVSAAASFVRSSTSGLGVLTPTSTNMQLYMAGSAISYLAASMATAGSLWVKGNAWVYGALNISGDIKSMDGSSIAVFPNTVETHDQYARITGSPGTSTGAGCTAYGIDHASYPGHFTVGTVGGGALRLKAGFAVLTNEAGDDYAASPHVGWYNRMRLVSTDASQFGTVDSTRATDTATSFSSFFAQGSGSAGSAAYTTTARHGFRVADFTKGANQTLTNQYGLYIDTLSAATNNWGLYVNGASVKNYMAGKLQVGTTSDDGQSVVQVNGQASIGGVLGYMGYPAATYTGSRTLGLADAGKALIHHSSATAAGTLTLPNNTSAALPVGTTLLLINLSGTYNLTVAVESGATLRAPGVGTGNRTLGVNSMCYAYKISANAWWLLSPAGTLT